MLNSRPNLAICVQVSQTAQDGFSLEMSEFGHWDDRMMCQLDVEKKTDCWDVKGQNHPRHDLLDLPTTYLNMFEA